MSAGGRGRESTTQGRPEDPEKLAGMRMSLPREQWIRGNPGLVSGSNRGRSIRHRGFRVNPPLPPLKEPPMKCLLQVNHGLWAQESYSASSGDARRRAAELRRAGYAVTVYPIGPQVTRLGLLRLSMVDIRPGRHADTCGLPPVAIEQL